MVPKPSGSLRNHVAIPQLGLVSRYDKTLIVTFIGHFQGTRFELKRPDMKRIPRLAASLRGVEVVACGKGISDQIGFRV